MSVPLVALLFEFPTLNGGERSMLAVLDWLHGNKPGFEFAAIAPSTGRLAEALRERRIVHVDWSTHDDSGHRHSPEQIEMSLEQIVMKLRPQLLHANSLAMGRMVGRIADRLQIPTTTHLRDIIRLSAATVADLNRNCRLVAVSNATRDFHTAQGIDARRICVVRNGLDVEQFQPRVATGRLHAELNVPRDHGTKLIATIGQIGLRKGQDVLAAAAPAIVEVVPGAHFILIGERTSQKAESVAFEQSIHRSFAAAGLADHLHVLGHRDDVPSLLNEIDLLVHPAHQEPLGRVLLEGSASGVAIVATNVGGTPEIIVDEETGLLVPPADPQDLAAKIICLLTDHARAKKLGIAAREKAVTEFSIASAAQSLANVWNEVLQAERSTT